MLAVELDQQGRTVGDEAAALAEPLDPGVVAELAGDVDVHARKAQRDGMHSAGGSGGHAQAKAAVEQGV